jgi:hypothetical protein
MDGPYQDCCEGLLLEDQEDRVNHRDARELKGQPDNSGVEAVRAALGHFRY